MLTDQMKEPDATDAHDGCIQPGENPLPRKFPRVMHIARKLFADSATKKNLIIMFLGSVYAFYIAVDTGLLRGIGEWERKYGLSNYPFGEFATLLMVLGVAASIFMYRRYQEIRGESLDQTMPDRNLSPAEIWAGFQYEELENLFRQVETAKKEWQLSLDSIKDMVVLSDLDGTIHRCNRAFKEFVGIPYEEILRENIEMLLAKFGIDMKGLDLEALNARFHISGKWFGVRSYPYTDFETGNITRVVIMMTDVSRRKVAEEKVQFVWGHKVYTRVEGGKANTSGGDSPKNPGDIPSNPGGPATRATF